MRILNKHIALKNIEYLMAMLAVGFFVLLAMLLHLIPVSDYVDNINGKISSTAPPQKLIANGTHRIARVHVKIDQPVRQGEVLLEFERDALDADLQSSNAELAEKRRALLHKQQEISLISEKIALNDQILSQRDKLKGIADVKNELTLQLDAERKVSTEKLRALSSKVMNQILPRIDDPMFSNLERMKIVSNAHTELRQMTEQLNQMQNNRYLPEETQRKSAIEAALLRKENADLKLARNNVERASEDLETEVRTLEIRIKKIQHDLERLVVVAPISGHVVNVAASVRQADHVSAGEEMFAIQDPAAPIEAELTLTDEQFKDARVGQQVNIELYAWNHYRHGVIPGRIISISRSKVLPTLADSKVASFVAKVYVPQQYAQSVKMGFDFKAKIILGQISLFDYFLKKLNLKK
jgi:hemolysin D